MPESNCHPTGAVQTMMTIGFSTVLVHFMILLCGIHPTMLPLHTLVSAFFLAFNVLLPVATTLAEQSCIGHNNSLMERIISKFNEPIKYLLGPMMTKEQQQEQHRNESQQNQQRIQLIHQYTALGMFVGIAACAILRILDHGMQIQRYPIPIIIGTVWGRCVGTLIGAVLCSPIT
jgi:Na+/H+ antiporter NhaA